jgi:hypothetical protein
MKHHAAAARVIGLLEQLRSARDPEQEPLNADPWLPRLRVWQSGRLARSFESLLRSERHRAAAEFFLSDLYGERDMSWRDRDLKRMLPTLARWLPTSMLETVGKALELDLVTQRLDLGMARALKRSQRANAEVDTASYAHAYRVSDIGSDRERQLELLMEVGRDLDAIVRKPLIFSILRLAKGPAHAAGLGNLQSFLERGFSAFRAMHGADEFLATIENGEREVMRRLRAGDPDPFRPA